VLFAVLLASLCSLLAASTVLVAQGLAQRRAVIRDELRRRVEQLASQSGGSVTPIELARLLEIEVRAADQILRSMVDDERFTMAIDAREGVIRYSLLSSSSASAASRARDERP
jgi:hypothetical protein